MTWSDPLKGTETLASKLNEFDPLAGFNMNKQKTRILTKNVKIEGGTELMNKIRFKIEKITAWYHYGKYELYVNCMICQMGEKKERKT